MNIYFWNPCHEVQFNKPNKRLMLELPLYFSSEPYTGSVSVILLICGCLCVHAGVTSFVHANMSCNVDNECTACIL